MADVEAALVWCPFPDIETARRVAAQMLAEKRIACANILPAVESIFEWQGECSSADEVAALFKTRSDQMEPLIARLGDCHPYDTPAIVGWTCEMAHPLTLQWLGETLGDA